MIFETFSEGVKSVSLGGTFGDFCDFWVPMGTQIPSKMWLQWLLKFGSKKVHFLGHFWCLRGSGQFWLEILYSAAAPLLGAKGSLGLLLVEL